MAGHLERKEREGLERSRSEREETRERGELKGGIKREIKEEVGVLMGKE